MFINILLEVVVADRLATLELELQSISGGTAKPLPLWQTQKLFFFYTLFIHKVITKAG